MKIFGEPLFSLFLKKIAKWFSFKEINVFRVYILILTFLTYMSYHATKRALSIVKPALNHGNCPAKDGKPINETDPNWCNWAPFIGPDARTLLGTLDLVFLSSYAVCMYFNSWIAERSNLKYFLSIGMICAGITNTLFGIAYYLNIHSLAYFYVVQALTGVSQSTGWPSVLAIVGNWFTSNKRGLIFGIWNSHIYIGNIVGAAISGSLITTNWGLSFIAPGIMIVCIGVIVFLTLIPSPELANLSINSSEEEEKEVPESLESDTQSEAITIIDALKIPGVIEFSICLFFTKLVSYTFLDWLPYYISQTNLHMSSQNAAYMTTCFDMGGIIGGIVVGYLADKSGTNGLSCIVMLIFAIPSLFIYYSFGNSSMEANLLLQVLTGIFVYAPFSLITTAISAELGSLVPSKSALSTVSGIIDATGSVGSAIGPPIAGYVSNYGWGYVFIMVMLSDLLAIISILRIGFKDLKFLKKRIFSKSDSTVDMCSTKF